MTRILYSIRQLYAVPALALAACATLGAVVLLTVPSSSSAAEGGPPVIVSMLASAGREITAGANINPEGLETTYEIKLECPPCEPSDQRVEGHLPAVYESRAVSLTLRNLQPGRYRFAVRAVNSAGEASQRSDTLEVPASPGSFPDGTSGYGVVNAPYSGALNGLMKGIDEHVAEERAKEAAARHAAEQALRERPASELTKAEAGPAEEKAPAPTSRCLVPWLKGKMLLAARRALAKAHCRLGKVSRPHHPHHGALLRVTRQSTRPGEQLPEGSEVALILGTRRASH
jgi:hypothetical protein